MDEFLNDFNREVQLSTTKCLIDFDAELLSIYGWSKCLTRGVAIALTIVDETDDLEWTSMIDYYDSRSWMHKIEANESFQVKIPSSSIDHSFSVTAKALRRISDSSVDSEDVDCYEVTSESCCTDTTSSTRVARISSLEVLDVRPRIRPSVEIRNNNDILLTLPFWSRLPAEKTESFTFTGDSVKLQIYQGDYRRASHSEPVHSIEVEFHSTELKKTVTLTLGVAADGTLTTVANERGYWSTKDSKERLFTDVICPKIEIDETNPKLHVKRQRTYGVVKKVFVDISTTYAEIDHWRVSVAEAEVASGRGGHVFLFPRDGSNQRFKIPSNILEAGVRYKVTVEGLEAIFGRHVDRDVDSFRIICRNSTTLKPMTLPARTSNGGYRMRSSQPFDQTSSVESMIGLPFQRLSTSHFNFDLRIELEQSTFYQASVLLFTSPQAARYNRKWKISIKKIATTAGILHCSRAHEFDILQTADRQRFDFPLQFEAGSSYRVTVAPMEWSDGIYQNPDKSREQKSNFRAELTLEDIGALYDITVQRATGYGSSPCHWLYRNKSRQYFENIRLNRGGIMEVYLKDNSGDPASPINLQIKGLFFMASVERGTTRGKPIRDSPFGTHRICIPAEELLAKAPNVYFVDFYCMRGQNHQVTLVMTRPGSKTDRFCAERLLPLDLTRNPFFFRDATGQLRVSTRDQLLVEVMFTENLDISRYPLRRVATVERNSSALGGIRENAACALCNTVE